MLCVLVVDDCPDCATSLQGLLQAQGYEACVAADGPTALDLADSLWPDVVVLEICQPRMDGCEVANSEKPFIVVRSGHSPDANVRRSLKAGFIAHLPKPMDPEDIRKILVICEKWLSAHREDGSRPTASLPARPNSEA